MLQVAWPAELSSSSTSALFIADAAAANQAAAMSDMQALSLSADRLNQHCINSLHCLGCVFLLAIAST
jgi:hypothetical protein